MGRELKPCRGCGGEKGNGRGIKYCDPCFFEYEEGRKDHDARRSPEAIARREKGKARRMMRLRYGMTPEQFDEMLERQGGRCAICGGPPVRDILNIDHDHVTGVVRALLCDRCNFLIGLALESPTILNIAGEYLKACA